MKPSPPLLLVLLVAAGLTPFLAKPFHIDDPLFLWTARQIAQHPTDPYGFQVHWYTYPQPMWEVTQNPPLDSYYIAAAGSILGWSEAALHAAFLMPAIAAVLATYFVARKLTRRPLLAALATLVSPAFLVSSTDLMCDVLMLALWLLAILAWIEGLEAKRSMLLVASGLLIGLCALTKYFGVALIPLLAAYTLAVRRKDGARLPWTEMAWLVVPGAILTAYEFATQAKYGTGLLTAAMHYASTVGPAVSNRLLAPLVALSFAGGCALPALTLAPLLWTRRAATVGLALGAAAGLIVAWAGAGYVAPAYRPFLTLQAGVFIAGGLGALALALADWKRHRDAASLLLSLWVLGTFLFAAVLNWTISARSLLPMLPAIGILAARRLEEMPPSAPWKIAVPLALAGIAALWVSWADARLAGSARTAAQAVHDQLQPAANVSFEGHWGFQYYMQAYGFSPLDAQAFQIREGDWVVIPFNNTNTSLQSLRPEWVASKRDWFFSTAAGAASMNTALGAGFYSSQWGPLPFAFGQPPDEKYTVFRLQSAGSVK